MASPETPTYEILALRYGIFDGRIAAPELPAAGRPYGARSARLPGVRHPEATAGTHRHGHWLQSDLCQAARS